MSDACGPQDAPGYERARMDGLLPVVPPSPPRLLAGPTADQLSSRVLLELAGSFVVLFLLAKVGSDLLTGLGLPAAGVLTAIGAIAIATMGWLYREWGRVGDRNLEELRRGYTTLALTAGGFRKGVIQRWPGSGDRLPWDYRGVWVLGNDGTVKQHPEPDVLPPGLYPSATHETRWELWSGRAWTGDLRPPPPPSG